MDYHIHKGRMLRSCPGGVRFHPPLPTPERDPARVEPESTTVKALKPLVRTDGKPSTLQGIFSQGMVVPSKLEAAVLDMQPKLVASRHGAATLGVESPRRMRVTTRPRAPECKRVDIYAFLCAEREERGGQLVQPQPVSDAAMFDPALLLCLPTVGGRA